LRLAILHLALLHLALLHLSLHRSCSHLVIRTCLIDVSVELLDLVKQLNDDALLARTLLKPDQAQSMLSQILDQSVEGITPGEQISLENHHVECSGVWEKAVQHTRMSRALSSSSQARQYYKDELAAISTLTNVCVVLCCAACVTQQCYVFEVHACVCT
jgi:hypothetical protein